jgi:hypothetical protein
MTEHEIIVDTETGEVTGDLQQLALLPPFEGRRPTEAEIRLSGSVKTPCRAMRLGEEIILVVKAAVTKVSHDQADTTARLARVHGLKTLEAHVLPDDAGSDALKIGQDVSRTIDDARAGRLPLSAAD